jgi:cytochrome c-type biogenesis protein CcmH
VADYGEALVLANSGVVSAAAHDLFKEALGQDPKLPKARFYAALALKQEGKTAEAKAAFDVFLSETPPDAPWRAMLEAEMRELASTPPEIDPAAMEAAANMSAEDRQAMIRSMVDGLEEKLKANGKDLDGWLRLIRARGVLGDTEKATLAVQSAKDQFKDDPQALARLEGLAKEMNIP